MNSFRKHATAMMAVFSVANTVVSTAIAQPVGTAQQAPAPAPARPSPMPPRPVAAVPMTAPTIETNPCQVGPEHSVPRCALRYMRETSQRKLTEVVGDGSRPITTEQMRALDQIVVRLAQAQVASNLTPGFDPAPFLEWWRRNQQDMVLNGVALVVRGAPDAEIGPFFLRMLEFHQEAVEIAASQRPAYIRMLEAVRSTWLVNKIVEPTAMFIGGAVMALLIYLLKTSIQGPIMATGSIVFSSVFNPFHNRLNVDTSRWGRPIESRLNRMLNGPAGIDADSVRGLVQIARQQGIELTTAQAREMVAQYRDLFNSVHLSFQSSSMVSVREGRASGVDALLLRVSHMNAAVTQTIAARATHAIRRHQLIQDSRASISSPAEAARFEQMLHEIEPLIERRMNMHSQTPPSEVVEVEAQITQRRDALIESLGHRPGAERLVGEIVQHFSYEAQALRQVISFVAHLRLLARFYSDVTAGALKGAYSEAYRVLHERMSSIPALEPRIDAAAARIVAEFDATIAEGARGRLAASQEAPATSETQRPGAFSRILRLLPGGRSSAPAQSAGAALIAPPAGSASGGQPAREARAVENATRAARAAGAVR